MATQAYSYWTVDETTPLAGKVIDQMGRFNISIPDVDKKENGQVGKYFQLDDSNSTIALTKSTLLFTGSFSVEFLFKPGRTFNNWQMFNNNNGTMSAKMTLFAGAAGQSSIPEIEFSTKNGSSSDILEIKLNGADRESLSYYMDGNWHHMVFTFDSVTGKKSVYVDGICPTDFTKTITPGNLVPNGSNHTLNLNSITPYRKMFGGIDEVAIYTSCISAKQVYQHYLDFKSGKHYSFSEYSGIIPTVNTIEVLNPLEFAPGTNLTSPDQQVTTGVNMSTEDQLASFPSPRYKPGNTLNRIFNGWMGLPYLIGDGGGDRTPPQNATNTAILKKIISQLIFNFNYTVPAAFYFQRTGELVDPVNSFGGMLAKMANDNPNIPASLILLRGQLAGTPVIDKKDLPNKNYLQNTQGQFLNDSGSIVAKDKAAWRPLKANLVDYRPDGEAVKKCIQEIIKYLPNRSTPKINYINENGEFLPTSYKDAALNADPLVVAERNALGLDNVTFYARKYKELQRDNYADIFLSLPEMSGAHFSEYQLNGASDANGVPYFKRKWSEVRNIQSTLNGQKYGTGDFYVRWPNNWRNWSSAWNGLQHFIQAKMDEVSAGDNYFSPFVSAGWDKDERRNMRPAQYLGLLKILAGMGAEFFHPAVFNEEAPHSDPKNYIWQAAMPAYTQAITSRYESIYKNSTLLDGDYPRAYDSPMAGPGYNFYTEDLSVICVVRKHNNSNKYIISANWNQVTNLTGNIGISKKATIKLDNELLSFNVRPQGSIYMYDKDLSLFYQLDTWHESTHPYYWSKNIHFNVENHDTIGLSLITKTTGNTGSDYSTSNTYISVTAGQRSFPATSWMEFNFTVRESGTYYLYVKSKSRTGSGYSFRCSVNGNINTSTVMLTKTNKDWNWYKFTSSGSIPLTMNLTKDSVSKIMIRPNNQYAELDEIIISSNPSLY